ncbi:MAG TPA: hypothetical protein VN673_08150, partial [Clostridia bacterium]|nr:hypothetical protein [Clostridia bacterium]
MTRVHPERRPVNSWINVRTDLRQLYAAYSQTNSPPATDEMLPPPGTPSAPGLSGETTAETASDSSAGTNVSIEVAAAGVLEALGEAEALLEELQTAGRRPYSRFNIQYDADPYRILLPHLAALRGVASILQVRATAQLAVGRPQEACEDTVEIFHMSNALRHEPFLISYLVRLAQLQFAIKTIAEGLEQQRWSDAHLAAFQKELAHLDLLKEGRSALEAERAFHGELIDRIRRISDRWTTFSELSAPMDPVSLPTAWQRLLANSIPDGWFYFERANYSRLFQDYLLPPLKIEERRVDVALCNRNDQDISATINRSGPALFLRHYAFSRILLPSGSKAIQRMALGQTGLDITGLACALERYRLAQGKYPDTLDALVPQYVARLPHDVIDGKPLRYRLQADGRFVLYSVGWNQTDDGGKLARGRSDKTTDPSQGDWMW